MRYGKMETFRAYLRAMRDSGHGDETCMIVSTDSPSHEEPEMAYYYEVDGVKTSEICWKTVYDHPVKTIAEWCREWNL